MVLELTARTRSEPKADTGVCLKVRYCFFMNAVGTRWAVIVAGLLGTLAAHAWIDAGHARDNDYRTIVDRNPFGLRPPPPPPTNTTAIAQPPKGDLKLTGVTTYGTRKAFFMMSDPKGKPEYYTLGIGEGKDGLEVLEIGEDAKSVRVRNSGIETLMTFASHGVSAPATGPAPLPGSPGNPAGGPGVPRPTAPANVTTAYNMQAIPGVPPATGGGTVASVRTIPSRVPRTDVLTGSTGMDPRMAARYGLTPSPTPTMPVITAPASPNPNNLSAEQQVLLLELQRTAIQKRDPRMVMPPTPGLPGQ